MPVSKRSGVLNAALGYAELGYRVLPVAPGSKRPLLRDWPTAASADPAVIEKWFSEHPNANIAILAEGCLVLDLDAGYDSDFVNAARAAEIKALAPPVQKTPRGGFHVIFRRPEGVCWRCSASKLAQKVDVKTNGGYILVAPSSTEVGSYRWLRPLRPLSELPLPPAWLTAALDKINPRVYPQLPAKSPRPGGHTPLPSCVANVGPIPEGCRHTRLLHYLAAYRAKGANDSEIAEFAEFINARFCVPPLPERECQRIVDWVCAKPQGNGGPR